jgi:LacI family transcriptional regulator
MVTSRDVARLAGVSQATVSRALSSPSKISAGTYAKVEAAMATLGYVPHAGAQAMKTRRTHTVGVVVADLTNPFYPEVLDELTRELDAAGYRVVLWNAGGSNHTDALKAIRERAVDGVVFTTATEDSVELQAAVEQQSPIVLINRIVDGLECDQVASSNRAGGALVADYLLDQGKTRIAFIGGAANASTSRDRRAGFLERMQARGHEVPDSLQFDGGFSHHVSAGIMAGLLTAESPPEAVFCANDYMAFGALDALHKAQVPSERCWVVGYDDVDMAAWDSFDLTTVRQPSREMARVGVRMLLQRLAMPGASPQRQEYPCELIVRGSTPSVATADLPAAAR